jgi:hypothetical protein
MSTDAGGSAVEGVRECLVAKPDVHLPLILSMVEHAWLPATAPVLYSMEHMHHMPDMWSRSATADGDGPSKGVVSVEDNTGGRGASAAAEYDGEFLRGARQGCRCSRCFLRKRGRAITSILETHRAIAGQQVCP